MSDPSLNFKPWTDTGLYLAGCEAGPDVAPPPGWSLWKIPAFQYAVIETDAKSYGEAFAYMLQTYLPNRGLSLAGAVHEFYPQPGNMDILRLYFPILPF
jgi:predicted transcriptional regulator YdeE